VSGAPKAGGTKQVVLRVLPQKHARWQSYVCEKRQCCRESKGSCCMCSPVWLDNFCRHDLLRGTLWEVKRLCVVCTSKILVLSEHVYGANVNK
jgi:hypothetical protein